MIVRSGFSKGKGRAHRTGFKDSFQKVSAMIAPGLCFEGLHTFISLILVLFTRKAKRKERCSLNGAARAPAAWRGGCPGSRPAGVEGGSASPRSLPPLNSAWLACSMFCPLTCSPAAPGPEAPLLDPHIQAETTLLLSIALGTPGNGGPGGAKHSGPPSLLSSSKVPWFTV